MAWSTTALKRQKELARRERQQKKARRREERRAESDERGDDRCCERYEKSQSAFACFLVFPVRVRVLLILGKEKIFSFHMCPPFLSAGECTGHTAGLPTPDSTFVSVISGTRAFVARLPKTFATLAP